MIDISGLSKKFSNKKVLKDLNLHLVPGELCFICGNNGAGKSTLLQCIAGLLRPSSGSIKISINDKVSNRKKLFANMGYAGTESMLYEDLSVEENICLAAALKARANNCSDSVAEAKRVLQAFDLTGDKKKLVKYCSSGVVKRTSLARAYLFSPKLLLLDEPFVNLDSMSRDKLLGLIKINQKNTVTQIIVSHDQVLIDDLNARTVTLREGEIVADSGFAMERETK